MVEVCATWRVIGSRLELGLTGVVVWFFGHGSTVSKPHPIRGRGIDRLWSGSNEVADYATVLLYKCTIFSGL